MPIYRVPELSIKPNFHNDQPPQDNHRHHHRRREQQHHHNQHQSHFDHQQQQRSDGISVRKSQSTPKQVTEKKRSPSPELLLLLLPDQGGESIVEREIRLQLEKEAEIAKLHRSLERTLSNASDELETTMDSKGGAGTYKVEEAESPDVGRRRHSSVADDGRHAISQYSRVGESLIARELMEQKRREDELLRNRHRNLVGVEGKGRNSSGKPDSGHAAARQSFQGQLSFEDPEEEEEEVDFDGIRVEGPTRRMRGDPLPPSEDRRPTGPTEGPRGGRRRSDIEAENLRRLATDRLREELLRERLREIDLRQQGKICTTSEERVGLDPSLLTKRKTARSAASSTPNDTRRSAGDGRSHRVQADTPRGGRGAGEGGEGRGLNRPSPPSRSADLTDGRQLETMRKSVELRIEEEVKESRKREKELREQRRLLATAILTASP